MKPGKHVHYEQPSKGGNWVSNDENQNPVPLENERILRSSQQRLQPILTASQNEDGHKVSLQPNVNLFGGGPNEGSAFKGTPF